MKKLTTFVGMVALTATLGLTGCKNKRDTEKKDEGAGKVTEPAKTEPVKTEPATPDPAKADPAKADPAKADPAKTDTAAANLPAECADYKAAVDKLASCDKLPQASRDALKQSFDTMSKTWANAPADDAAKKAMSDGCKGAADAVKQAASQVCGW